MSAGYSGTPLARKLGIGEGDRVATMGAPDHLPALLGELPHGATLNPEPPDPGHLEAAAARSFDVVLVFSRESEGLERTLPHALRLLDWDGGLWLAWPKKSSSLETDLDKMSVRAHGLESGLVDNKVCAVDEDWSGLRFVYRTDDRPDG